MQAERLSIATMMPVMIASPAAIPSEPPMNSKSWTAVTISIPSKRPVLKRTASAVPVLARFSFSRSV
jgi:hypothetical protein